VPPILKHRTGPSRSEGFTLLEVLLAFVVFALSFAVVLEILSGSMRNTARAKDYTEATLIAQSVMDQVGLDIPLKAGERANGEVGKYTWEADILAFDGRGDNAHSLDLAAESGMELLEVDLLVSWGEYPREQSHRFSTLKAVLSDRR